MQDVLDRYGAGIRVEQVQLLKADPPAQVIDAFRDVQAAATDKETLQNQAFLPMPAAWFRRHAAKPRPSCSGPARR
jgi:regulator of protease activity HflC (stomatin/prohibitin superfamily)